MALYDAEQNYYYLKRFYLEATQKIQNLLGENTGSRLIAISDKDYPRFEVRFGGHDAYREPLEVDAEEFIGVKSFKAKGKRLSTFMVDVIKELEPLRFNIPDATTDEGGDESSDEDSINGDDPKPTPGGGSAATGEEEEENYDPQKLIDEITGQMTLF